MGKIEQFLQDKRVIYVVIFLAALLPFLNIFQNDFAYDDPDFFLNWNGVKHVNIVSSFLGDVPLNQRHVYRPIRSILQATMYSLTSIHPFGYHIFSLLVHLINTFLVFFILKKFVHKEAAFFSAIIFAVLPVHVASITFITASFNTAGLIFLFLSFYFYILFQERKITKYFYYSLLAAYVAYYTYELALILPLLLALYDICIRNFSKKQFISQAKYYLPYVLGSLSLFFIKFFIIVPMSGENFLAKIDFSSRMLTTAKALTEYVYMVIVNYPLSVYHEIIISKTLDARVLFSIFAILIFSAMGIYFYKKNARIYSFIIFWFFISLIPVANFIQIASFMDEQYLYLASFSWALLVGISAHWLFTVKRAGQKIFALVAFIALVLAYGYLAQEQNAVWKNDETLWAKTMQQHPQYTKSYNNLSLYYIGEKKFSLAEKYAKKALEINPKYALAYENLGIIQMEQKQYNNAIIYFQKAAELNPNYAPTYQNLGFCYQELGKIGEAEKNYKKAIEILPSYFQSHKNLAVLYLSQEMFSDALDEFIKAASFDATDYELYFGMGMSYSGLKDGESAKKYYQKTLEMNPDFAPAREMLQKLK